MASRIHRTSDRLKEFAIALELFDGNATRAALEVGIGENTGRTWAREIRSGALKVDSGAGFRAHAVPNKLRPVEELLAERCEKFKQRNAHEEASKIRRVDIKEHGPIAVAHIGDPHVDDDGTDIIQLRKDVAVIKKTKGMFGATVGDLHNNWVGRLARLYGEQSTSSEEAWQLVTWLLEEIPYLYVILGNHDKWAAAQMLYRILEDTPGVVGDMAVRFRLVFPNKKEILVNAKHDHPGHSMYNPTHGQAKAAQRGWPDHIVVGGHKHVSGYQPVKQPATGLLSHCFKVGGYKRWDMHARDLSLDDHNFAPTIVTLIQPQYEDQDPRLIQVFFDVEEAAEVLTWKRKKAKVD